MHPAPTRHSVVSLVGRLLFLADVCTERSRKKPKPRPAGDTDYRGYRGYGQGTKHRWRPQGGAAQGSAGAKFSQPSGQQQTSTSTAANHTLLESRQASLRIDQSRTPVSTTISHCFGSGMRSWRGVGARGPTPDRARRSQTEPDRARQSQPERGREQTRWKGVTGMTGMAGRDGTHPVHIFDTRHNPRCVAALLTALRQR